MTPAPCRWFRWWHRLRRHEDLTSMTLGFVLSFPEIEARNRAWTLYRRGRKHWECPCGQAFIASRPDDIRLHEFRFEAQP